MSKGIQVATALLIPILLAGCATRTEQGTSSIEMLEPIDPPQAKRDIKVQVEALKDVVVNDIPPTSKGELAKPVYPPAALAAHAGACVVNVTITIDTNGLVTEVTPSWQRLNVPGPFYDEFLGAVKAAVRTWRFEPARDVYWKKHGDDDLTYMYAEVLQARTDVRFTFESSGRVR
jgi:hypothetical protein